jgi:alpha-amylase
MRSLCLCFNVHQPVRLRKYNFFDIGTSDYYWDDYNNERIIRRIADECYLPANKIILDNIQAWKGLFKIAFSVSGTAIEQFRIYAPEVLESFQNLADTGFVEFVGGTYSHSLASLANRNEFRKQVFQHSNEMVNLFGYKPTVFCNTELIYSDEIGEMVADMGFKAMLTEGSDEILRWRSPNFLYCHPSRQSLQLLLKNFKLSDDIAFRFSDTQWSKWPLTAGKYVSWLNKIPDDEEVVNLFMDYETFGEHHKSSTGILKFLDSLPFAVLSGTNFGFRTPCEVVSTHIPVSDLQVPSPVSWADKEKDLSAWLGNEMQQEAFEKLYELVDKVRDKNEADLSIDCSYLQTSDHFYYMSTKINADGEVHAYFNPYETPYLAFINYMNVLNDFQLRLTRKSDCFHPVAV